MPASDSPQEQKRENALATLRQSRYAEPAFAEALGSLRALAEEGDVLAALHVADLHAQIVALPDRWREAARYYALAARGGHPAARDRLGDLHLLGLGVERSARRALECWLETARSGYPIGFGHLAYAFEYGLGTPPDPLAADRALLWAAAFASPYGFLRLGWRWAGHGGSLTRPDLAWACARVAADFRYPHGTTLLEEIDGTIEDDARQRGESAYRLLAGYATDLERAVAELERRDPALLADGGRFHSWIAERFAPVGHTLGLRLEPVSLPPVGSGGGSWELEERAALDLPPVRLLDPEGLVAETPTFASLPDCAHVMELVYHELRPSGALVGELGEESSHEHESFDGFSALLDFTRADVVVHGLRARLRALLGVPEERIEPFSVLRYLPGNRYRPHVDALDETRLAEARRRGDHGGQRLLTFLVTLSAARRGGETLYPRLGLTVPGRTQGAVWHRNADAQGRRDERLLHEGRPILEGEKWLLRTSIRARALSSAAEG